MMSNKKQKFIKLGLCYPVTNNTKLLRIPTIFPFIVISLTYSKVWIVSDNCIYTQKDAYLTTLKVDERTHANANSFFNTNIINFYNDIEGMRLHIYQIYSDICGYPISGENQDDQEIYEDILHYIEKNLADPQLSLASLASHFGLNPSFVSCYFKEKHGMNYLEYVNRSRIILAKQYMVEKSISIKEIASLVGFNNDITFRRLFKKYEGTTPTEFRNKIL